VERVKSYATFAAVPIGTNLAARDGGLTLTALGGGASGTARSNIALDNGTCGVEFVTWGDDAQTAIIGLCTASAPLTAAPGHDAQSIGWNLAAGTMTHGNADIANGLPAVGKHQIAGIRVERTTNKIQCYISQTKVWEGNLPLTGALHFAASLSSEQAGGLILAVNAGQWIPASPAAAAGWAQPAPAPVAARIAERDYLDDTHARYEGLLVDGMTVIEALGFWSWKDAAPNATAAEVSILDVDGRFDALVMNEAVGSPVTLRRLNRANNTITPGGRWRLDAVSVSDDHHRRLRLTDPHDALDTPISRGVFLPNLPALAFKPIPVVIGAVASVPALSANNDGTVRFLTDNAVHVADVMDRGDLMEPGTFSTSPDGQQLLMEHPPVGPVVCDLSSIGLVNNEPQPATLQQALSDLFARIGFSAWSSSDAAAIDAASGYAGIGYYASEPTTARTALHAILASYGAWYYRDDDGVLRFVRITAPEAATPTFEIDAADMSADLVRETDSAPNLTRRVAYRPNAQALSASDLVTDIEDVPQARRDQLTALWRGQVYAAGSLPARYSHADSAEPFISTLWRREDAQTEADRVIALYSKERASFQVVLKGALTAVPSPGKAGLLRYPKYGLETGLPVIVRRIERRELTNETRLVLWG